MRILLLNTNPIVSKLVKLSAERMGYECVESTNEPKDFDFFDLVILDDEFKCNVKKIKKKSKKLLLLKGRSKECDLEDILVLNKPFLPTDLIALLNDKTLHKNQTQMEVETDMMTEKKELSKSEDEEDLEAEMKLALDSFDLEDLEDDITEAEESKKETTKDDELDHQEQAFDTDKELDLDLNLNEDFSKESPSLEDELHNDTQPQEFLDNFDEKEIDSFLDNLDFEDQTKENKQDEPKSETQESEMNFDDLPEDASFIGQNKDDEPASDDEFEPSLVELPEDKPLENERLKNVDTFEQIKEDLAELDALEAKADEKLAFDELDTLSENDLRQALESFDKQESIPQTSPTSNTQQDNAIISELSKSIAAAVSESIKDDTLKAALKGMNMNISINIKFDEKA